MGTVLHFCYLPMIKLDVTVSSIRGREEENTLLSLSLLSHIIFVLSLFY